MENQFQRHSMVISIKQTKQLCYTAIFNCPGPMGDALFFIHFSATSSAPCMHEGHTSMSRP